MMPQDRAPTTRPGDRAREHILRIVSEQPGVHKSALCRSVGLGWGTVSYHLRLLERTRQLQTFNDRRETFVFPAAIPEDRLRSLAAVRKGSGEAIASVLQQKPGSRQHEICQALGLPRKLIRRHLAVLRNEGLVTSQGDRRARYTVTPAFLDLLRGRAPVVTTPIVSELPPPGTEPPL